ncbi:NAD(P)-dependent dehydrogenase, short-chain alcohol dehydrogenase family [Paenibacillus algorifonticola]|uniref:NAD(P)-dependent dehydrogenase, short-chain alcohol dehydrogenase family n=1 Tax=Paenibacillus algorifonticola TaxID=684063 RepID=A0A1I2G3P6_9BACL|nr:SDR family NAD(P)-dependent oxidoreductase [Paenibacillus algorifonticola]SFF11617.1 NAD(P)-dependent dehydrogenase, short-chain alcohol dehydrogenase family [Paenibacillus algorifonticola]
MTVNHNKVALITGANSGVGFELTKRMLSEGWEAIALIRSGFPNEEPLILEALKTKQLRIYRADLSDFASLKQTLDQIKKNEEHIEVLFNNAGVSLGEMKYTKQQREMHFEVNTLVPYIIFMELKELLLKGTMKTIVNTSSNSLLFLKKFDSNTLDKPTQFKKIVGPYGASKLALSLWTKEIAPSLLAEGIQIRSVCPGGNKTTMTKNSGMPAYLILIRNLFFSHPSVGASRLYDAAFGDFTQKTGIFLHKGKDTALKFTTQSHNVLHKVNMIYKKEFGAR